VVGYLDKELQMRRIVKTAAALAAVALAATACSGGTDGDAVKAAKDPQRVSGTVTWWDTSDATNEAPVFKELVAKFEKKYPKITVKYVNVPFDAAQDKFKTAAQSGSGAPDVFRAEVAWTPGFAKLGYLQPIDGTPAADGADDYLSGPVASTRLDGKTYGVPQVTDTLALLYNKALLAKAGVTPPKTMDELKTAALTVKAKTGAGGLYLNPGGYFLLPFLYGEGGDLVDAGAKKITVNSPEAAKAVDRVKDLISSGAAMKPDFADGYNNMQASFKDGKVAMVINGPWSVADDLKGPAFAKPENLGIAPVPAGTSGKAGAPTGGHNYVIYAGSAHLDASYLFVQFMNSTENQAYLAEKLGLLPTRKAAYEQSAVKASPVVTSFGAVLGTAVPRPAIPEGGDLFTALDENYVKVLNGSSTTQKGLDDVASAYKRILTGWR
jgi:arabinogalactan oligomer/maltooligosaccharide transport system substrate-binding protein